MPLRPYACGNCGHWQMHFAPPPDCPVCSDTRNDLPEDGWDFWTEDRVAAHLRGGWREIGRDVVAFGTTPRFGLDGTGWLLTSPAGNVAFEAAPYYTAPMLDEIARRGGIAVLAASHVHGYGALWQLQRAFDPEIVAIQREDLRLTKAFRVNWPYDERLALPGGQVLHHVGGHYEGQAVLHDPGRRMLFCGDAFKVDPADEPDARAISSHKAFHKDIPLTRGELARYRDVIGALAFDAICTPFDHSPGVDTRLAVASIEASMAGRPEVRRMTLGALREGSRG